MAAQQEVAVYLVFCPIASVIIWKKPTDAMALFVSFGLLTYGSYVTPPLHEDLPDKRFEVHRHDFLIVLLERLC